MAILKKDLNALRKDFKALEKKMEKLLKAAELSGKPPKTAKAKTIRKAPAKRKTTQVTATDQILKIIKRSKKGVDVPTLKKKTGFDDKKVRNIVFRAAKEGRIKKSGRGVYVGS